MQKKPSPLIIFVIPVLVLACSFLSSGENPTPTPKPVSTSLFRMEGEDIFCSSENAEAKKLYNDAGVLKQKGNFAEAEKLYEEAIKLDPNYCDAMDNLGQLLRQQNKIEEAIGWYKKSLEIKPDNTVALQNLALAYNIQGQTQKSIETYEKLTEVAPNNPEGFFGLGTIYFRLEQPEKAIPYFETAETLYKREASPYVADAQYYLGFSYLLLEDCANVTKYFVPIYSQFSTDGGINYGLGVCYLQLDPNNPDKAREFILKAKEAGIQIPPEIMKAIGE